jgi:hypothetical protein
VTLDASITAESHRTVFGNALRLPLFSLFFSANYQPSTLGAPRKSWGADWLANDRTAERLAVLSLFLRLLWVTQEAKRRLYRLEMGLARRVMRSACCDNIITVVFCQFSNTLIAKVTSENLYCCNPL